jgi:GNAT superfamily N-acetyltransferase
MQNCKISVYNRDKNFNDLKLLVEGHQAFIRNLEPQIAVTAIHKFNLEEYLYYFFNYPRPKIIFLAFVGNEAAGYISNYQASAEAISVYRKHTYAVLNELFVVEKFRRKGIATSLIQKSKEWARYKNCEFMQVGYVPHNEEAKSLYNEKAEFEIAGQISRIKL